MLRRGHSLLSHEKRYRLVFQHDGEVVIYCLTGNRPVYSSKSQWLDAHELVLDTVGTVLLKGAGKSIALWSGPPSVGGLPHFTDNGLIEFGESGGNTGYVAPRVPQPKSLLCNGETLTTSRHPMLVSSNGIYQLECLKGRPQVLQWPFSRDALVLRRTDGASFHPWEFWSSGNGISKLKLDFGAVCPITDDGAIISGLYQHRRCDYLELLDSGALVVRSLKGDISWASERFCLISENPMFLPPGAPSNLGHRPDVLHKKQRIISQNGDYQFRLNEDGNAALTRISDGFVLFETRTRISDEAELCVTADGRILLESIAGASRTRVLSITTPHNTSGVLSLTNDGNLVYQAKVYGQPSGAVLWQALKSELKGGEQLRKGEKLVSPNRRYSLVFNEDGNAQLLVNADRSVLFETATRVDGDGKLVLQAHDGNLVVCKANGDAAWGADAHKRGFTSIQLTDQGQLRFLRGDQPDSDFKFPLSSLRSDRTLKKTRTLISPNGRYSLQTSGGNRVVLLDLLTQEIRYDSADMSGDEAVLTVSEDRLVFREQGREKSHHAVEVTDAGSLVVRFTEASGEAWRPPSATWSGDRPLVAGDRLLSPGRRFELIVRDDGFDVVRRADRHVVYTAGAGSAKDGHKGSLVVVDNELLFKHGEEIRWRTNTRSAWSHLEVSDSGVLKLVDRGNVIWSSRRIACIAWGSLVWDPRTLPMIGQWYVDGPMLKVEYKRRSRDGRITLVLSEDASLVQSLWVQMASETLPAAVRDLATREGIPTGKMEELIGSWSKGDLSPKEIPHLAMWAHRQGLDHVVWTNLPEKLPNGHSQGQPTPTQAKKPKSDSELDQEKSQVLAYLKELVAADALHHKSHARDGKRFLAEQYIRRTPEQIATGFRKDIEEKLGWTFDPHF
ncbi:hypothetical protein ED208_01805 [Stagnimonas aquatica]|uniref:Bulb-type lectin domain-containing protein n=1 Tax=Stagnimonas aquatica TaxID=2689987 RepID=A0A3N0VKP7_9GAMM|nr:hypothetical protein ED208_01805 [Stagnimonas aquatica]